MRGSGWALLAALTVYAAPLAVDGTTLAGVVRDAESLRPLAGANVRVGDAGTLCDDEGRFRLDLSRVDEPSAGVELIVTIVGYDSLRRTVPVPDTTLDLRLRTRVLPMPETLVEGRAPDAPVFVEVGRQAGFGDVRHDPGADRVASLLQATGSGLCVFDATGDGIADVYFVNGARPDAPSAPRNRLFRGSGSATYVDITTASGTGDTGYGMGCVAADVDADGDTDLYVTNYGANRLLRNEGGRFVDVASTAGVDDGRWSVGAGWADIDGDGDLDLFVANYLDYDANRAPVRSLVSLHEGFRSYPGPRDYDAQPDALFRNEGDGRFTEVGASVGLTSPAGKGMGAAFVDLDADGDMDLFVANDRTPNHLYRNDGGQFAEIGLEAGVAFDEGGHESGAMGVDAADIDADGRVDLFVTNFSFEYNSLYRNRGDGTFADVTGPAGLAGPSYRYVGWGSLFLDYDNDGDEDLFVANGDVLEDMDLLNKGVTFAQPDQLFRNEGDGTFVDISRPAGLRAAPDAVGRGAAALDADGDGDLDVVVVNLGARPSLWRNDGDHAGGWLSVEVPAGAAGARLRLRDGAWSATRQARAGHSYLSQSQWPLHIGLGRRRRVEWLEVRWPNGSADTLHDIAAGTRLRLEPSR